jgi:beta-lactamase class A
MQSQSHIKEKTMDFEMKKTQVMEKLLCLCGNKAIYYKNINSGEVIAYCENEVFASASVIKVPLCAAVLKLAEDGETSLDEKIDVRREDMVPSMGTLHMLADEIDSLTVRTLCRIMINTSDNSATNLLIKRFGFDRLNAEFEKMGVSFTRLGRLMMDKNAPGEGRENYITALEIGTLLESIYHHTLVSDTASSFLEKCLLEQQFNHKLPCDLRGVRVGHKTGENYRLTHDAAIVYASSPFVLVVLTSDTDTLESEQAMREIAQILCQD